MNDPERQDEYYMQHVLELAERALEEGEFPIASIVVLGGEVIATAATAERREGRFLVHAGYEALPQADRLVLPLARRRAAALYTNLEPCLMGLGAAMTFFLGRLIYALESPSDGAVGLVSSWHRPRDDSAEYRLPQVEGGVLRGESIRLFRRYVAMHPPGPMWEWARLLAELE
jgi:tRNA(adenine34) deaminase